MEGVKGAAIVWIRAGKGGGGRNLTVGVKVLEEIVWYFDARVVI